jgi:nucleoside-diphosphate-sugar epimerase
MRIFVAGATGYIGTAVTRRLCAAGHDVVGLARSDASAERLARAGVGVHRGDLAAPATIRAAATDADAVVHVAVGVQVGLVSEVDVAAFDAMVDAMAGTGRPLVVTSGVAVYAGSAAAAVDEDTPLETPLPAQVPRIRLEERVVQAAERGVRTVVLRPGFGYGHAAAGLLIRVQVERARRTGIGAYVGDGGGLFPVVHVDDLAGAYLRAVEHGRAGSRFNIVGRTHSARERPPRSATRPGATGAPRRCHSTRRATRGGRSRPCSAASRRCRRCARRWSCAGPRARRRCRTSWCTARSAYRHSDPRRVP